MEMEREKELRPMGDNPIESISHDNIITAYCSKNPKKYCSTRHADMWLCRVILTTLQRLTFFHQVIFPFHGTLMQCMPSPLHLFEIVPFSSLV